MGGHAFESDGLKTPRIPTELYDRLKKEYAAALAPFYDETAYPEEAPGKPDHGDVDILAQGPHETTTAERVASALNAKAFKSSGAVTNYAVPHPTTPDAYVQLDVQKVPPGLLPWQRFLASYGDLSQILGVVHRPLGLTSTDRGLHVRIAAIEPTNKKVSMIHLSHDPSAALAFLGLDLAAAPFASEAAVFAWVATGRFFDRYAVVPRDDEQQQRPEHENHNDRARRAKRDMYRRFVDEWVPAHPAAGAACGWSRERVLDAALDAFGRRGAYDERLAQHRELGREEALWRAIKERVPRRGDGLGLVVRGLKRWVSVEGGRLALCEEPLPAGGKGPWVKGLGEGGEEAALRWVEENWAAVREKEKAWAAAKKARALPDLAAEGCGVMLPPEREEREAKKMRSEEVPKER